MRFLLFLSFIFSMEFCFADICKDVPRFLGKRSRCFNYVSSMRNQAQEICGNAHGYFHENGMGFVANTALVHKTAYIGRNTFVCGYSIVEEGSILEEVSVWNLKVDGVFRKMKEKAPPCEGEVGYFHPTGLGFVSKSANVEKNILISPQEEVCGTSSITFLF